MKKTVLTIILTFLCLSVDASACNEIFFDGCTYNSDVCCSFARTIMYDPEACELTISPDRMINQVSTGPCAGWQLDWRSGNCLPTEEGESIGGCNGSSAYFECSPVYTDAQEFSSQFPDIDKWWYFKSTGGNGETYKCMSIYKNRSGETITHRGANYHAVDPATSTDCISEKAFTALNNNANDLSQPSNAYNAGISTNR